MEAGPDPLASGLLSSSSSAEPQGARQTTLTKILVYDGTGLCLYAKRLEGGRFGRRSERLGPDQLQLGLEDLEQTAAAAEAAQEAAARSSGTPRPPRVRRRNLGALPAHLPRIETLVDLEDKSCPYCGGT